MNHGLSSEIPDRMQIWLPYTGRTVLGYINYVMGVIIGSIREDVTNSLGSCNTAAIAKMVYYILCPPCLGLTSAQPKVWDCEPVLDLEPRRNYGFNLLCGRAYR